jgi:glucose-6-phosphate isomerase
MEHARLEGATLDVRQAFAQDPARFDRLSQSAPHVFADLSKNRFTPHTETLLMQLAREVGLPTLRDAMLAGEPINLTEGRAVLHTLLRTPAGAAAAPLAGEAQEVQRTLVAMLDFAERVRADRGITDVVNIGIGGSDLGPQMATLALQDHAPTGQRLHFVSNVDGHELDAVLQQVQPAHTLFIVASKTFTTIETLTNARSARDWFTAQGGTDIGRHFAALTTNIEAARHFGISTTFGFWDWVGGRYSLWSSIGLPLAIAIGADGFRSFLQGAHAMDRHFAEAPLESNLPVRLGLLDVWYRNGLGWTSRSVAPYSAGLRRLPAYLQQLEMESNGKRVDAQGQTLPYATSPVVWGEPGTNGQHAFFQMLHQGTDVIPVEFIAVRQPSHRLASGHQSQVLANVLAQGQALLQGQADGGGHRHFPGNRPSTLLLLERLTPESLGALIALYEHRVFTSGAVWGLNSFDQWGVELGKTLAKDIAPRLQSGLTSGLDPSTAALVRRLSAP